MIVFSSNTPTLDVFAAMKKKKRTQQISSIIVGTILGVLCALFFSGLFKSVKDSPQTPVKHSSR
jgi:hypothetical protein